MPRGLPTRVTVGEKEAGVRLRAYGRKVSDFEPLWRQLIDDFARAEAAWFSSRGEGKWPPLSPGYARWKEVAFPGRPLMVRTGRLKESLTSVVQLGARADLDRDRVSFGTSVPYAKFHQETRPPVIPAARMRDVMAPTVNRYFDYP
jgi:phage gpG-like protein